MTTEDEGAVADPPWAEEVWLFGGLRLGAGGKKCVAWLPNAGAPATHEAELWYAHKGAMPGAVGSLYTVQVQHADRPDGTRNNLMRHNPAYLRRCDDPEVRALVEARHRAVSIVVERRALEANDKRDSALREALEPLLEICRQLRMPDHKAALMAYVMREMGKV